MVEKSAQNQVREVLNEWKEVHTCLTEQLLEELLVVDPCHAADLLHLSLSSRFPVDEVGRDADGQLASQLLVLETWRRRRRHS